MSCAAKAALGSANQHLTKEKEIKMRREIVEFRCVIHGTINTFSVTCREFRKCFRCRQMLKMPDSVTGDNGDCCGLGSRVFSCSNCGQFLSTEAKVERLNYESTETVEETKKKNGGNGF